MGHAVSKALTGKGDWDVHIFDMARTGNEVAKTLGATYHQIDVTDYSSLGGAFKSVFKTSRRLDFVHANAGIIERGNFYKVHDTGDEPPPPLPSIVVDIDLMSVVHTSYLAQHYFRQTPSDGVGPRSLIVTASCGGFYACPLSPVYGAAKHGTVGWTRSIANRLWREDGIRVNVSAPRRTILGCVLTISLLRRSVLERSIRISLHQKPGRRSLRSISSQLKKWLR